MLKTLASLALTLALGACAAAPAAPPQPTNENAGGDAYALAIDAIALGESYGDAVWPGLGALDRTFAVVDETSETVVCTNDAPGFSALEASPVEGCLAFRRDRIFPTAIQASLNLLGPVETVVTASPEALGQSPVEWKLLFLHERFHEWQSTSPDYLARVAALDLAGDDQTGMWMLNFDFPYDDEEIAADFQTLGAMLATCVQARGSDGFVALASAYRAERRRVFDRLPDDARRYLEFQLWKEGAARWTEIALAEILATSNRPDADAFAEAYDRRITNMFAVLEDMRLGERRRGVVYELGAGELMVTDALTPAWRETYTTGPLSLARFQAPPSP